MSDPAKYRSREEVQAVREQSDPIEPCRAELEKLGVKRGRAQGDRQARSRRSWSKPPNFAEEAPEPEPAELYTDVLVESY